MQDHGERGRTLCDKGIMIPCNSFDYGSQNSSSISQK